jgi:hypothetical protein
MVEFRKRTIVGEARPAVIIGDNSQLGLSLWSVAAQRARLPQRRILNMRSRDLAAEMASAPGWTTFTLPVAQARTKAREIINGVSVNGVIRVIENWRQRSDGRIEFAVRNLRASD